MIRRAETRDAQRIGDLWRSSGLDPLPTVNDIVTLVLEDEAGIVAFCAFAVDGKRAVGLGVASSRVGAGTTLMREAFKVSKELGCSWVLGAVRRKNVAWHRRLGYETVGYAKPYFADGEPAWIMAKVL